MSAHEHESELEHEHEHQHEHEHKHEHHRDSAENMHGALPCDGEGHEHHHHADGSCCCHHHETEYHGVNPLMAVRLGLSVVLYACGMIFETGETLEEVLMIAAALIAGYDIVYSAIKNLFSGKLFDEYFLMTVAAIAACIIGEYEEGAAVMVLYRVGETCQDYAIRHSRRRLATLTGEYPAELAQGGRTERFITKFARVYTPVVLALAIAAAILMPLVVKGTTFSDSVYRALTFLVLACPCAIVISVPMAYFAGLGAASRKGIFFHDSTAVDEVAKDVSAKSRFVEAEFRGAQCLVLSDSTCRNAVVIKNGGGGSPQKAVSIARKARLIAFENIWFVILVKLIVLVLSLLGISALWFAVFADSGVAILAILNSLRVFGAK